MTECVAALAYDLETTGGGANAEIVDFAAVCANVLPDGTPVQLSFQSYVLPGCEIQSGAKRVHGLSRQNLVQKHAEAFPVVLQRLCKWLEESIGFQRTVVWAAHNGNNFDHKVLRNSMNLAGFQHPAEWVTWDTLPIARSVLCRPAAKGRHTLRELFHECSGGLQMQQGHHCSLEDARALACVWRWLAMQDSVTYGRTPSSFQEYLQWIAHESPMINSFSAQTPNISSLNSPSRTLNRAAKKVQTTHVPITPHKCSIRMDAATIALPGVGRHIEEQLNDAGIKTVADLFLQYERLGRHGGKLYFFLKKTIPRAHPGSLRKIVGHLAAQTEKQNAVANVQASEANQIFSGPPRTSVCGSVRQYS